MKRMLSFFLGVWIPNVITGLSKWCATDFFVFWVLNTLPDYHTVCQGPGPSESQYVIQVVTFWRVNFWFRGVWWSCKKSNKKMPLACLQYNFLSATFWSIVSRGLKHSKGVYHKPGQNVIHAFCEKALWLGKIANFGGFPRNVPTKKGNIL